MNEYLKDLYNEQSPESSESGYNPTRVWRFTNIFRFMDFCFLHKLTPNNSITYYDEKEQVMYLKKYDYGAKDRRDI